MTRGAIQDYNGAPMLNEPQRTRVWEGWLSAEIRANYFAELSHGYYRKQRWASWLTLVASSGAAITLIGATLPVWVPSVLALSVTALSVWSLVVQHQKCAVDSADLHFRWNRLAAQYEALWADMYADDAAARLKALDEEAAQISKVSTSFPARHRRLTYWQRYVEEQHHPQRAA